MLCSVRAFPRWRGSALRYSSSQPEHLGSNWAAPERYVRFRGCPARRSSPDRQGSAAASRQSPWPMSSVSASCIVGSLASRVPTAITRMLSTHQRPETESRVKWAATCEVLRAKSSSTVASVRSATDAAEMQRRLARSSRQGSPRPWIPRTGRHSATPTSSMLSRRPSSQCSRVSLHRFTSVASPRRVDQSMPLGT